MVCSILTPTFPSDMYETNTIRLNIKVNESPTLGYIWDLYALIVDNKLKKYNSIL